MIALDFRQLEQQLKAKKSLRAAADSPEGRKVMAGLDSAALSEAAAKGDGETLRRILAQVLSSPEGKALAEQVQRAVRE